MFDGFISSPENIVCPVDLDGNDKSHPPLDLDSVEQVRTFLIQKKTLQFHYFSKKQTCA